MVWKPKTHILYGDTRSPFEKDTWLAAYNEWKEINE